MLMENGGVVANRSAAQPCGTRSRQPLSDVRPISGGHGVEPFAHRCQVPDCEVGGHRAGAAEEKGPRAPARGNGVDKPRLASAIKYKAVERALARPILFARAAGARVRCCAKASFADPVPPRRRRCPSASGDRQELSRHRRPMMTKVQPGVRFNKRVVSGVDLCARRAILTILSLYGRTECRRRS